MPLRVRASVCGRGERDRDIPEAREARELGRRQGCELVVVQTEVPVVNTHEKERAHECRGVREREQREVSVGNTQSRRELVGQREVSVGNTQARRE